MTSYLRIPTMTSIVCIYYPTLPWRASWADKTLFKGLNLRTPSRHEHPMQTLIVFQKTNKGTLFIYNDPRVWKADLMDRIESVTKLVHCQTIQRLNDQLLSISKGHISKAEASNNQITLLQSQLLQMTNKVDTAGILGIQNSLWQIPNSVSKGFGPCMREGSFRIKITITLNVCVMTFQSGSIFRSWKMIWDILKEPLLLEGQNICWKSLAFIID